ncbi:hypothetical protein [Paludisphaera mucosa]|uniref:Uncharacterized protein n=1 Tax=Paludisphaera mucosa TaxID=3030827 RepID=A0ABT6F4B4_9BACT|nr:hypothetical protein [Paludisphaera mucosa]MDG3002405.1 hypothetical protein [Paludisphaera mucosa]
MLQMDRLRILEAFRPVIAGRADLGAGCLAALHEQLLRAIGVYRVPTGPTGSSPG